MGYFHALSYVLSRLSFVAAHLVVAYWFNFIFNDPFNLRAVLGANIINTLDAEKVLPAGQCTPINYKNLANNVLHFSLWCAFVLSLDLRFV